MDLITVALFGHRYMSMPVQIEKRLEKQISKLIYSNNHVTFLVGRDGDFDRLAASVIRRCKRDIRDDNSVLIWVMAYLTADFRDNEDAYRKYYDEIHVGDVYKKRHYKAAHEIRNREMVDCADLVLVCVEHDSGGAYKAMRYAKRIGKPIINIAEMADDIL